VSEPVGARRCPRRPPLPAAGALALTAALLAGIGCAGHDSPRWRWDRDQQVLPLRSAPAGEPRLRSVVILLPEADGSVGVVEVANSGGSATLSRPREAVAFDDLDNPFIADDADLERYDRPTLDAEPAPPQGYTVYFRSDEARLDQESEADWEAIVGVLAARSVPEITVVAHADSAGSEQHNLELSRQRAEAIRDALVGAGLDGALIEIAWFGESRPAILTSDGVAERQNRRAEIRVR
jgi:outer membrane protein OmpA-like peptidoglycan-associated protein